MYINMAVLGTGAEIVECLRIAKLIERHGEQFIHRVFTPHEIDHCKKQALATQHYAARWAAKVAVLKAVGLTLRRGITWRDIEIKQEAVGPPTVHLLGAAHEIFERSRYTRLHVSMSHCRAYAVALVVAEGPLRT